jgi:putative sigma-54 modulation protein
MEIKINPVNFTVDQKLVTFIENKIEKLQLFLDVISVGEVFLRLDKDHEKENKIVEIKLLLPGKELFAKRQCKTFEEACDEAVEALRRQVKKYKGKKLDN